MTHAHMPADLHHENMTGHRHICAGIGFEGDLQVVQALLTSLCTAAPVRVSPVQTIILTEHLAAAIIAFLRGQIQQSAVTGEVSKPCRPAT